MRRGSRFAAPTGPGTPGRLAMAAVRAQRSAPAAGGAEAAADCHSRYRGVIFDPRSGKGKYQARIAINRRAVSLG